MDDVHDEVIDVDSDHDDTDEEEACEVSTSGSGVFAAPQQVFVVKGLSKAISGFRPSVTCEGYLAELSCTSAGYALSPLGADQQLSFKYEPPSPKFSRKRPSCVSYRLQLLQGSQFLYSLRGLPRALRCQRAANALEWGPVHVVFESANDLTTFTATLKYVEVVEEPPPLPATPAAVKAALGAAATAATMGGEATAMATTASGSGASAPLSPLEVADAKDRSGSLGAAGGSDSGSSMQWAEAVARLLVEASASDGAATTASAPSAPMDVARPLGLWRPWSLSYGSSYCTPLLAATAGAAFLASMVIAYLVNRRGRGGAAAGGVAAAAAVVAAATATTTTAISQSAGGS